MKTLRQSLVLLATVCLATSTAYGVVYTEVGDAGRLRNTAQPTGAGNQPLTAIFGNLLNFGDIDLFVITITNPLTFSASTVNALTSGAGMDTSLFLFDVNGRPLYANDDDLSGTTLTSSLPAGSLLGPQVAGTYYLAISLSSAEPVNFANIALFILGASTSLRGPNPIATGPLTDWDTSQVNGFNTTFPGPYQIDLTGTSNSVVPEPTTVALSVFGALGLIALARKRRLQS